MKEVIMKKLLFWMVLICSVAVILTSCSKDEESTTAASTSVTSTTASGSITVGSETLSGTYVSACNTTQFAAAAGSFPFPSDVKSGKTAVVVTGNTALTEEFLMYTDSSCSTLSLSYKNVRDNVTVGAASGSNYLVTYNADSLKINPSTEVAETFIETFATNAGQSWALTVGTESTFSDSGDLYMNLFLVTSTTITTGDGDKNTQPTAMDSMVMTKE
jgi:hypothetical protein